MTPNTIYRKNGTDTELDCECHLIPDGIDCFRCFMAAADDDPEAR